MYSVVTNISNGAYPVESEDIANYVSGDSWIFIDGYKINKTNFDLFITEYKDWITQNGISGSTQIIFLNDGVIMYLTEFNYTDYLDPSCYTERESISIKK